MDKNSVTGMVLIALIFGVFYFINKPSAEEIEAQKRHNDSIAQVEAVAAEKAAEESSKKAQAMEEAKTSIPDSVLIQQKEKKYGMFASAIEGEEQFYTLENELIKVKLSNKGGKVYSVQLKEYTNYKEEALILFDGQDNVFGFGFNHNLRTLNTNDLYFEVDESKTNSSSIRFKVALSETEFLAFDYKLPSNSYMLDYNIVRNNINDLITTNTGGFDLKWETNLIAQEKGRKFEAQYSGVYYKYYQDVVEDMIGRSKKEELDTPVRWVAFKDQFFSSILIAKDRFLGGDVETTVHTEEEESPYIASNKAVLTIPIDGGAQDVKSFQFYFGPNKYKTLKQYEGLELQEVINLGWWIFGWINKAVVINVFNWLESSIASYGLIILILTILIKLVLFPLTYRSYISTAKMRVLKPQIDAINEKIPSDKAMERQQATMALYRKAGVSPLGGCLPMLLQMPILFAMFRFFPASIELRHESFLWATDLSSYDAIITWTGNIPLITKYYGNHISLFTLLMAATNIFYTKINQEMTQSSAQMPGMKGMMYMMPVMFMVFFNQYASGLSYYYFVSTLITIIQTIVIRRFVDEEALLAKLNANQKKPKKKSGFQARLEEMQRQQQLQQKNKKKKK